MCFDKRDAALAAACKERDDLKKRLAAATEVWDGLKEELEAEILRLTNIAEHRANMNHLAAELALQLDTVTADRNRLQEAYEAMSRDLAKMSGRLADTRAEAANYSQVSKALRDRGYENFGVLFAACDQVKAERDAAISDLQSCSECWSCGENGAGCKPYSPTQRPALACGSYIWRGLGVQK